jgi:hypothetical protein
MSNAPTPGTAAPPIDLPAIDGGRVRLGDPPGRPMIVSFLRHAG